MWIYFIKEYAARMPSGEVKVYPEESNINCPDDEKALDLIKKGYCIESQEVPVR